MCGIVGYIGSKNVDQVLLPALERLEYRGYDSAGVATLDKQKVIFRKEVGKLRNLVKAVDENPLDGHIGIGHTRWATHGAPCQRNAHPHTDGTHTVAVVHNGIIENHETLRRELEASGCHFVSDTDTEVIAHLVGEYHVKQELPLEDAVYKTIARIEGNYAFCVISSNSPEQFVAARNGSPLVIGLGDQENFVASDATAFLEFSKRAFFLDDYEVALITRDQVRLTNITGAPLELTETLIDWDSKAATKEGYDHFMLKEIEEQPKVLERIIRMRLSDKLENSLFDEIKFDPAELQQTKRIILQACGTSWHAALSGKYLFETLAGIPTEVEVSSEFRYRNIVPQPNTLLLSITQSGETIDALMAMRRGKEAGFRTLSICNVLGSTIARESDGVIYTHAGPEIGVASTKAYTAQLATLFLLAIYWAQVTNHTPSRELNRLLEEFKAIPQQMREIIANRSLMLDIAQRHYTAHDFLFLGRGINYPVAHEGALKIKEIAYIHATGHPAGEMKHGPIALIDEEMPVVCIAPDSRFYDKMASNIQEVTARNGKVIALATLGNSSIQALASEVYFLPQVSELLSPLLTVVPLQYLAYYVALLRGTDVDQPRNLAKSVTVE